MTVQRNDQRGEALVVINFSILGRCGLRIGDDFDFEWAAPKPRGLLSVLLLRGRQAVSVDELLEWIWPDGEAPKNPASTLHTYRHRISQALERMDNPPKIRTRNGRYMLSVDPEEVDFHEFGGRVQRAAEAARQGDHVQATEILRSAVDELWAGLPLPDLEGDLARDWRRTAHSEYLLPAYNSLMTSLRTLGNHSEVLRRLVGLPHELRTSFTLVKHHLAALHDLHRPTEAHEYYLAQRKRLKSEDCLDEADELKRLHETLSPRGGDRQAVVSTMSQSPPPAPAPRLLPHEVGDFIGRESLLQQLDTVLFADGRPAARVAVLSGSAGVGKTTLALRWAHRVADQFPGGQLYKNLNGFAEENKLEQNEVVTDFLAALGIPPDSIPSHRMRMVRLRSMLSGSRTLVVLDNVRDWEHIRHLLDCLPNSTVLITTRPQLHGLTRRGAFGLALDRLSRAEGRDWLTKWFGARADSDHGSVKVLADLCGGLPLALRIVADHVLGRPGIPLAEFVTELREEQALLGLGDYGGDPGSTVRAALSWSYHALSTEEKRCFRLLGANPGPDISLAASAALFGRELKRTARVLDQLVDAHLVEQPESRTRFRLHDLVRQYARELVHEDEERHAAEERLICFYLFTAHNADRLMFPARPGVEMPPLVDKVQPVEFPAPDSAVSWARTERANLNAVIIRLAAAGRHSHHYASTFPSAIGEIFNHLGYRHEAAEYLRIAVRHAGIMGDYFNKANWLGNLAFMQIGLNDFDSAQRNILAAKALYEQLDNPRGIAMTDYYLGRLMVERRDARNGIKMLLSALAEFQRIDAAGEATVVSVHLGEAYRRLRDLRTAESFLRSALKNAERLMDTRTQGVALVELAATHLEQGDPMAAKDHCLKALRITESNDPTQTGKAYAILASVHNGRAEYRSGEICARRALNHYRSARDSRGQARTLRMLGQLLYCQARHEEAADSWSLAAPLLESTGDLQAAAAVRERLAEAAGTIPTTPTQRHTSPRLPKI